MRTCDTHSWVHHRLFYVVNGQNLGEKIEDMHISIIIHERYNETYHMPWQTKKQSVQHSIQLRIVSWDAYPWVMCSGVVRHEKEV